MVHFSWFFLIPGVEDGSAFPFLDKAAAHQGYIIPTAWLACGLIILLAVLARMRLEKVKRQGGLDALVPDSNLGPRNLMEIYVSAIFDLAESVLGRKDALLFFPLIGCLFIYVLGNNVLGLMPGFLPATDNMSNNLGLALIVFLTFNIAGLIRNRHHYVTHLAGPVILLAPLFFPLEVIGLCVRPISLSLRLAGNMFGDHMVFGIMSKLVPPLLPIPFLGLGAFVCFIQALVFTLLTTIYIALAVAPMDEHH